MVVEFNASLRWLGRYTCNWLVSECAETHAQSPVVASDHIKLSPVIPAAALATSARHSLYILPATFCVDAREVLRRDAIDPGAS